MKKSALLLLFIVILSVSVSAYNIKVYQHDSYKDTDNRVCHTSITIQDKDGDDISDEYDLTWSDKTCGILDAGHCRAWQRIAGFEYEDKEYYAVLETEYWTVEDSTASADKCFIKFRVLDLEYTSASSWSGDLSWTRETCSSTGSTGEYCDARTTSLDSDLDKLEVSSTGTKTNVTVTCNVPETTLTCPAPDMSLVPACPAAPACTCNSVECPDCTCPSISDKPLNIKIDFFEVLIIAVAVIGAGVASYLLGKQGGNGKSGGPTQKPAYNQYPPSR